MIKITITLEDVKKSLEMPNREELTDAWTIIYEKGFIFPDFTLLLPEMTQIYKVKFIETADNQMIHIKKIQKDDYGSTKSVHDYDLSVLDYIDKVTTFFKDLRDGDTEPDLHKRLYELYKKTDNAYMDIVIPMSFMQYIMVEGKKRSIEYVISAPKQSSNKKSSYSSSNKNTTYKLLDCIKIYEKKYVKGTHKFHVDEFPRRGGFRHLASGKVVPYRATTVHPKNKGTQKHNGRDYTL